MKSFLVCFLVTLCSCAAAGELSQGQSLSPTASPDDVLFSGYSYLREADISVIDLTDLNAPVLLTTVNSDADGYFEVSLSSVPSLMGFVATGGFGIDPLNLGVVRATGYELKTYLRSIDLGDELVFVSPYSTLKAALLDCLAAVSGQDNLFLYSSSLFSEVFQIDHESPQDITLAGQASAATDDFLYSAYNLAFFRMATRVSALSGFDVADRFAASLSQSCSLVDLSGYSKNYSFHEESFRGDYLSALLSLGLTSSYSDALASLDLAGIAADLRANNGLLFGYRAYE